MEQKQKTLNLNAMTVSIFGNPKPQQQEPQIEYKRILVTPEIAQKWLTLNTRNRKLNQNHANRYAEAMLRGEWEENGQCITFYVNGELADGQHRLAAVVKSGCSIWFGVMKNVPLKSRPTIDDGYKRSSAADFETIKIKNSSVKAAIVSSLSLMKNGKTNRHQTYDKPSRVHIEEFYNANKDIIDESIANVRHYCERIPKYPLSTTYLCALYIYLQQDKQYTKDVVCYFIQNLVSYNTCNNKYIEALRIKFLREINAFSKMTGTAKYNLLYKTFNDFISNKKQGSTYRAYWSNEEGNIEIIPNQQLNAQFP